ncbi:MAG: patatin-like phospholipase family protein, partial [Alphaproteobacteria bacterium]
MSPEAHVPFALVLAGGGVRGLAHAGVLKAVEHYGFHPSAVVGVSMGAVVAVTYALNPDWYGALVNMDTEGFPDPPKASGRDLPERIRALLASERMLQDMVLGWGVGSRTLEWGRSLLDSLTLGRALEEGHIRV